MNNLINLDMFEKRRPHGDPLFHEVLEQRYNIRSSGAAQAFKAMEDEDHTVARDYAVAEAPSVAINSQSLVANVDNVRQLARPVLSPVAQVVDMPTIPEMASHDNVAFLDAARQRVNASQPTGSAGYVPDHPRVLNDDQSTARIYPFPTRLMSGNPVEETVQTTAYSTTEPEAYNVPA